VLRVDKLCQNWRNCAITWESELKADKVWESELKDEKVCKRCENSSNYKTFW